VDSLTEAFPVLRLSDKGSESVEDVVVRESPLTIILNDQELATLLCTPADLKHLAIGFLFSEGLVKGRDRIRKVMVDERVGVVRVEADGIEDTGGNAVFKRFITSGCGRGASFYSAADVQGRIKVDSRLEITASEILALVRGFQGRSTLYRATGGVHSAALCDTRGILLFSEDIGRHNAIDKIFGQCIWADIVTDDRIVITSGRISSEILIKVARRNIPMIVSKSAPTNLGLNLATDLGVTLVGFARGKRMNVYTHDWRVKRDD